MFGSWFIFHSCIKQMLRSFEQCDHWLLQLYSSVRIGSVQIIKRNYSSFHIHLEKYLNHENLLVVWPIDWVQHGMTSVRKFFLICVCVQIALSIGTIGIQNWKQRMFKWWIGTPIILGLFFIIMHIFIWYVNIRCIDFYCE